MKQWFVVLLMCFSPILNAQEDLTSTQCLGNAALLANLYHSRSLNVDRNEFIPKDKHQQILLDFAYSIFALEFTVEDHYNSYISLCQMKRGNILEIERHMKNLMGIET